MSTPCRHGWTVAPVEEDQSSRHTSCDHAPQVNATTIRETPTAQVNAMATPAHAAPCAAPATNRPTIFSPFRTQRKRKKEEQPRVGLGTHAGKEGKGDRASRVYGP